MSPYQIDILKTRMMMFLTRENDIFALQNIGITTSETRRKEIWPILSAVLQLNYIRSIKPNNVRLWTVDCGLRTADNGFRSTPPWKNSFAHIVILKRFLKFAIAKMEMSNSSSLPLTPLCCEAWPPRLGNMGGIPFESHGNVRRLS